MSSMVLLGMTPPNLAHVRPAEPCTSSLGAPDRDTDESQQACTSSNALFGAQPADLHFDLVEADDSPEPFSVFLPDFLTEPYRQTDSSATPQGAAYEYQAQWKISSDTDCDYNLFGISCNPSPKSPLASDFANCSTSKDVSPYTSLTQDDMIACCGEREFDFEFCTTLAQSRGMGFYSNSDDLDFQFEFNSTHLTDISRQINRSTPSLWPSEAGFEEFLDKDLRCDWPQCSSLGYFDSIDEHKSHIKQHAREVSKNWSAGKTCTWYQCSSKASHRSQNLFDAHVNNIHVNPLVCTVKNCKHKTPFRANHDLQRHIATAHNVDSRYSCPYTSCGGRGFIRKDKWMSHLKSHHDTEPCPYAHCQRQIEDIPFYQRSISKHIGKAHSNFECALKTCHGKISRFAESQLLEHLQLHHAMEWVLALKVRDVVKANGDRTLTAQYLKQGLEVRDCKICTEGSQSLQQSTCDIESF